MSAQGIKEAAVVFQHIQLLRIRLLGGDKQDMLLGQMLEEGKNAMAKRFIKITAMKVSSHPESLPTGNENLDPEEAIPVPITKTRKGAKQGKGKKKGRCPKCSEDFNTDEHRIVRCPGCYKLGCTANCQPGGSTELCVQCEEGVPAE